MSGRRHKAPLIALFQVKTHGNSCYGHIIGVTCRGQVVFPSHPGGTNEIKTDMLRRTVEAGSPQITGCGAVLQELHAQRYNSALYTRHPTQTAVGRQLAKDLVAARVASIRSQYRPSRSLLCVKTLAALIGSLLEYLPVVMPY